MPNLYADTPTDREEMTVAAAPDSYQLPVIPFGAPSFEVNGQPVRPEGWHIDLPHYTGGVARVSVEFAALIEQPAPPEPEPVPAEMHVHVHVEGAAVVDIDAIAGKVAEALKGQQQQARRRYSVFPRG